MADGESSIDWRDITVRVRDARLTEAGGPVRVVLSGGLPLGEVAEQVASGGGQATLTDDRIEAVALPDRLVDAVGRVGGADLATPFRLALQKAVTAWVAPSADLPTRAGVLPLSRRPVVMGILNVTPDSFSDGGQHASTEAAIAHGRRLVEEGADLVDVGGESTRPGAEPVAVDLELARVVPVVQALAEEGAIVSVDTTKAPVAEAALEAGAAIVNDVSAGTADPALLRVVAAAGVPWVAMHARGTPRDMQDDPQYDDVVAEVFDHLAGAVRRARAAGIAPEALVLDPGIGFGKTAEHNLAIIDALRDFRSLGAPVLLGASRKSFLGLVTGVEDAAARVVSSVAVAVLAADAGASILRVHDVAETVEALKVASSVRLGEPVDW